MPLPGKQVEALGHRLRVCDSPDPADIALLGEVLIGFNGPMSVVAAELRSIGLQPTTRLKSTGTVIDKLKRTTHLNLRAIQDLAGARVVAPMTLDEQDAVTHQIMEVWPSAQCFDRRAVPSYGYRAVHIIPKVEGCRVEIQLRTMYQDTWAQIMEQLGDAWGRTIRYGGPPSTPDREFTVGTTRSEFINLWIRLADELHRAAECENELARLVADGSDGSERGRELRRIIEEDLGPIRKTIQDLAQSFGGQHEENPGRVTK